MLKIYFDHSCVLKIEILCILIRFSSIFSKQNILPRTSHSKKLTVKWDWLRPVVFPLEKSSDPVHPNITGMHSSLRGNGVFLQLPEIPSLPLLLWRVVNLSPSLPADNRWWHHQRTSKGYRCSGGTLKTHWGVNSGLRSSCQQPPQRSRGSGMATEQWRGQAVHSHFMTQTNLGQEIQVATWRGHELQHKWIVLTNQLWSIKPNKMYCIT